MTTPIWPCAHVSHEIDEGGAILTRDLDHEASERLGEQREVVALDGSRREGELDRAPRPPPMAISASGDAEPAVGAVVAGEHESGPDGAMQRARYGERALERSGAPARRIEPQTSARSRAADVGRGRSEHEEDASGPLQIGRRGQRQARHDRPAP